MAWKVEFFIKGSICFVFIMQSNQNSYLSRDVLTATVNPFDIYT